MVEEVERRRTKLALRKVKWGGTRFWKGGWKNCDFSETNVAFKNGALLVYSTRSNSMRAEFDTNSRVNNG